MATAGDVVYVIDDDENVRRALARLLCPSGLTAETFLSAVAVLECDLPDRPACLILDVCPAPAVAISQETLAQADRLMPVIFITGAQERADECPGDEGRRHRLPTEIVRRTAAVGGRPSSARSRPRGAGGARRAVVPERFDMLIPREREVLGLVVAGMFNKQIAAELGAAERTIKIHRGRVMHKRQADSVADLVRMAQRIGVGPPTA